jgi:hypothetical protein
LQAEERSEEAEAHLNHADKEEDTAARGKDSSKAICSPISQIKNRQLKRLTK